MTELLFRAALLWVRRYYPGLRIESFTLRLSNGKDAVLPLPELLTVVEAIRDLPEDADPDSALDRRARPGATLEKAAGANHAPDFSSVCWYDGKTYHFSPTQRPIIAHLWQAMDNGAPAVPQATLLAEAESNAARLRDLFRNSDAWEVVIVPAYRHGGPIGSYQLAPPPPSKD